MNILNQDIGLDNDLFVQHLTLNVSIVSAKFQNYFSKFQKN